MEFQSGDLAYVKTSGERVQVKGIAPVRAAVIAQRYNDKTGAYEQVEFAAYELETADERIAREYSGYVGEQKLIKQIREAEKTAEKTVAQTGAN
jgi:hypothetical protein